MTNCRRTEGILERLLDDVPLSTHDLAHLRTCGACAPASARVPGFNGALRFATQALVSEPIPPTVLDAEAMAPMREGPSRLMLGAAGLAVVVAAGLAIAILRPDRGPEVAAPLGPALVAERQVIADLQSAGYACSELTVDPKAAPVIEGTVCDPTRSDAPLFAAIVLERDADGDVRELIAKASPDKAADADATRAVVDVLMTAIRVGVVNPDSRLELEAFVTDNADSLSRGESGLRLFGRLIVQLERFDDLGLGLHVTVLAEP
jgi:hypothetical protein